MATNQTTLVNVNEDYIDMELITSSSPNFFSYSTISPSQNKEFEFQMTSISNDKDSKTSPADDLFYKGKLLPLHLPPRIQMVQNILENSNATSEVSSEVTPDEYLFGWSSFSSSEKSWPKKLKQIKQFWLGQRLKASKTYLKSMFTKSGCSNNVGAVKKPKCKECHNKYLNVKKNPFEIFNDVDDNKHPISYAVMKTINKDITEDDFITHRKSFSGMVQRHCAKKSSSLSTSSSGSSSSSSSFSFSSAGYYDLQLFKRRISANSDLENSVEGAIAHCKMSQMQHCSSKNNASNGIRICSQFASKIADCGNQEMCSLSSTRG
ncbi:hypothetical protein Lalb_Chr21g0314491 [Lupinus albus]|uniref:Uncharacterized protein n=1 Tax=Lupinus albus TaxID=3870 RepID=A0A6A4NQR5_LUPAL|nr:hypothetical protein Lalb_Chr21g0314491 [Lupinus albus]